MLDICYNLLISWLLTCQRVGLLGRRWVQDFGSPRKTFASSMFRRFAPLSSPCYYASAPVGCWHWGKKNLRTADYHSLQQQLRLSQLGTAWGSAPCYGLRLAQVNG